MQVLPRPQWLARRETHEARAADLSQARRERRSRGESHAVDDFLWTYYSLRPGRLARWHAGVGVVLLDADERPDGHHEVVTGAGNGSTVDVAAFVTGHAGVLEWTTAVLGGVASRPARHDCFGLHEWAMVYRADERRHAMPLRLGQARTDAVVESRPLRCSHIDAFRFFTDEAVPLNDVHPSRDRQPELDHAGCVHVTMDLLKWALKLGPLVPGDLLLDCFELARDARTLDMRASPYDVSGYGLDAVPVETTAGRATYAGEQRRLAARAAPLRERLLGVCRAARTALTEAGAGQDGSVGSGSSVLTRS